MIKQEKISFIEEFGELLPGTICEMDTEMKILCANKNGLNLFGVTEKELKEGVYGYEFVHPGDAQRCREEFKRTLKEEFENPREYRMLSRSGEIIRCLISSLPVYKDRKIIKIRSVILNVTELHRAQKCFEDIFSKSPLGMALFDNFGTVLETNSALKQMLEDKKQIKRIEDLLEITASEMNSLNGDRSIQKETTLVSSNKRSKRYLEWHVTSLGSKEEGGTLFVAQVQDVTAKKEAELRNLNKVSRKVERADLIIQELSTKVNIRYKDKYLTESRDSEMSSILEKTHLIAQSYGTVLITGESGTGKEFIARQIHDLSPRRNNPFIAINCSALPEELLISELFGYKSGAFTDAKKNKLGKFELANGGTIFLDEIGDMPLMMQTKILRVIQERVIEPLGGTESIQIDVRIITATNSDLKEKIKSEEFRKDLYYRINVIPIHLPPLRDRKCDIPLLCNHFINRFNSIYKKEVKGITPECMGKLYKYNYPGNLRELENILEHAFVFCKSSLIETIELPEEAKTEKKYLSSKTNLKDQQTGIIESMLIHHEGNVTQTAQALGIHKSTLYRKIKSGKIKR
ncbi:sigma 54-interacting transcriptional regulator [Chitinispirillales bacterium ANBcel5]|uniref:sigma 54-interacting transcriptional regulator n=1 Tax=Cellulosispirillum alkaliphilum TaxID=3039283 RepID=UPI002A518B27|nr:sigma 54-interacting transcriptional regulator [Chitinispirillales bacterium ANBcel5]